MSKKVHVPAHELRDHDPEGELEFLLELVDDLPEAVVTQWDNLGSSLDHWRRILGYRVSLGHGEQPVVDALRHLSELGVALFHRTQPPAGKPIQIVVSGQPVWTTRGADHHNNARSWMRCFCTSAVLRDRESCDRLRAYDFLRATGRKAYRVRLAEGVGALTNDVPRAVYQLKQAAQLARHRGLVQDWEYRFDMSIVALARAVAEHDEPAFNERLEAALRSYAKAHSSLAPQWDPRAVLPLPYLGLVAMAHDRGMQVDVESGYLPRRLYTGEAFQEDPTQDASHRAQSEAAEPRTP